ncbi:MAG: glycosyl transferase [Firmicutes bacterium HGW-Firmicutes-1]|jgi:glycosyltransferase involved in cell wall biosynthesis|nr:MAG: glycosyl transferase [Firmicutes bacterium HGW-Firmicutes-1]
MIPPMVSFVTWNRAGLNARNLTALLKTTDDFELYIIDNGSKDDTWEFIQSLEDDRIKLRERFEVNRGLVYAMNYILRKRKKEQFYITLDSDVSVLTEDFVRKYMNVMDAFPEVGLLGAVRDTFFEEKNIKSQLIAQNDEGFYPFHIIVGCCICIRPEVFEYLGYWNEETCGADIDICARINKMTPYKTGFIPTIFIDQTQRISCDDCLLKEKCTLIKMDENCFDQYDRLYKHREFAKIIQVKEAAYLQELNAKRRTAFCASIHDPDSTIDYVYNHESAKENFEFFIKNAN